MEPDADIRLITVFRAADASEVAVAQSMLMAAKIDFATRNEAVQDLMGWGRFPFGVNVVAGPVELQVREEDAAFAHELLAGLHRGEKDWVFRDMYPGGVPGAGDLADQGESDPDPDIAPDEDPARPAFETPRPSHSPVDRMSVIRGDITTLHVDAIVNAANETLLGGGGVDGAIHDASGPGLDEECRALGGCPTGGARMTGGYNLPARHVIHAVGPRYRGGLSGEASLLRWAYTNSLELAEEAGVETIAFPCISTGVYGYPPDEACDIAVAAVTTWLQQHELPREVTFCCYLPKDERLYRERLEDVVR